MTARRPRLRCRREARDEQEPSPFASILGALVARVAGARGAALVDGEGETVDYAGRVDPFDLRLTAAHLRIVLHELARLGRAERSLGAPRSFALRAAKRSFIAWSLPDEYALVVALGRRAGMGEPSRAFAACERALCREAGWSTRASLPPWHPVAVDCDRKRRPLHVRSAAVAGPLAQDDAPHEQSHDVHVLGAIVGLPRRERGYRVRLASGREISLLREAGGFWYADEPIDPVDSARAQNPAERPKKSHSSSPARGRKKNR